MNAWNEGGGGGGVTRIGPTQTWEVCTPSRAPPGPPLQEPSWPPLKGPPRPLGLIRGGAQAPPAPPGSAPMIT